MGEKREKGKKLIRKGMDEGKKEGRKQWKGMKNRKKGNAEGKDV